MLTYTRCLACQTSEDIGRLSYLPSRTPQRLARFVTQWTNTLCRLCAEFVVTLVCSARLYPCYCGQVLTLRCHLKSPPITELCDHHSSDTPDQQARNSVATVMQFVLDIGRNDVLPSFDNRSFSMKKDIHPSRQTRNSQQTAISQADVLLLDVCWKSDWTNLVWHLEFIKLHNAKVVKVLLIFEKS